MLLKACSLTSLIITRVVCLSPVRIKNPNLGLQFDVGDPRFLKDRVSEYINVRCGHCSECISNRQLDLVQRALIESMKNEIFFMTLTYNNDMLPHIPVNGYDIKYAEHRDVVLMFKRLRKNKLIHPFSYFGVSELGKKRGRPHFHCLLFINKSHFEDYNDCKHYETYLKNLILDSWCINFGSTRNPRYVPCCTYVEKFINNKWRRNFDLQYCSPAESPNGCADVAFYCLKYLLKPSERETRLQQALHLNLPEQEYKKVWSLVRSRSFYSTGFGISAIRENKQFKQQLIPDPDIVKYLHDGVVKSYKSNSPFPLFYHPNTGQTFPLSHYYYKFSSIISNADLQRFYFINNPDWADPCYDRESLAYSELIAKLEKSSRSQREVHFSNDDYLDDLCL